MRKGFGFHDRHSPFRFDPATLFIGGAIKGAFYDPSNITTLFQDDAGTTPVTAVEQTVGRILDLSGNGNHATQTVSGSRPTYRALYNIFTGTATLATQTVTTRAAAYTLTFTGAGSIALSGTATGTYTAGTHSVTCTAGALTATVTGTVTNADMRLTIDVANQPAYQAVVTSTNYNSVGFRPYLAFDGGDDSMSTASINFTGTNKMSLFAGVTKLSDAATALLLELSANINANTGSFFLAAPIGAEASYSIASWGVAVAPRVATSPTTYPAPNTNVVTGLSDIAGDSLLLRLNGTQVASSTLDQGTGNFGNYSLFIGRRNNTSLPFNGRLYGLVVLGAAASSWQVFAAEQYMAQKTGISII